MPAVQRFVSRLIVKIETNAIQPYFRALVPGILDIEHQAL